MTKYGVVTMVKYIYMYTSTRCMTFLKDGQLQITDYYVEEASFINNYIDYGLQNWNAWFEQTISIIYTQNAILLLIISVNSFT